MADERDYFAMNGADIRLVANGYIIQPGRAHDGSWVQHSDMYVFATVAELAAWLKTRYKAHG